jgi:D-alanyl-D-alanine dipeptidase
MARLCPTTSLFLVLFISAGCGGDRMAGRSSPPPADGAASDANRPDGAVEDANVADAPAPDSAEPPSPRLTDAADYLVTVRTRGWDAPEGTLARYRRDEADPRGWVRDGADITIILGRSGVGWGRGVHGEDVVPGLDGPVKREGDGRSPAGAFWLDRALGYAPTAPAGTRIAYQAMTPTLQCIEDVESAYYNRIVDRAEITPDWDSTDRLLRDDGLYELLVFVNQNVDPAPVPGRGSCILFHVWSSETTPTAGCTSMTHRNLQDVIARLAPERNMLVQLPGAVYDGLADAWGLPL